MSIATAITNLQGKIANAYTAIENKGGTLPATQDAQNLATAIQDIPQSEVDKRKYGATIDDVFYVYDTGPYTNPRRKYFRPMAGVTSLNATDVTDLDAEGMQYMFMNKANLKSVSFPALRAISSGTFKSAFKGSGLSSVSFPVLSSFANGAESFQSAFQNCTALSNISFPALSSFNNHHAFESAFEGCTSLSSVSFPELTTCYNYAFYRAFANSGVKSAIWPKYNSNSPYGISYFEEAYMNSQVEEASFPALTRVCSNGFKNAFKGCSKLSSISFPELNSVANGGLSSAFQNCTALSSVSFPALTTASGAGVFESVFYGCTSLTTVSFPALTTLSGTSTKIFYGCTSLTTVSFPELTALYGAMFTDAFQNCTSLTSVSFPKLQSINKTTGSFPTFGTCFVNCGITTLSFPALTSIVENAINGNTSVFKGGTSLTRIDFPVLSSIKKTKSATSDDLQYLFSGCTNLVEIHFGAENQSIIEGSAGYATKWGAPNAECQIYFDL